VGQSATFKLAFSSVNGFADTFDLSCRPSINGLLVGGIACSFSPPSGTFDASGNFSGQLTVNVTARPRSADVPRRRSSASLRWALPFVLLGSVVLIIASEKRGKASFVLCCITVLSISLIVACGGGSGGSGIGPTPTHPVPTPTPPPAPQNVKVDVLGSSTTQFSSPPRVLTSISVTVQ
jgi:hypothetical protein